MAHRPRAELRDFETRLATMFRSLGLRVFGFRAMLRAYSLVKLGFRPNFTISGFEVE